MKKSSKAIKVDFNRLQEPFIFYNIEIEGIKLNNQKLDFEEIRFLQIKSKKKDKKAAIIGGLVGGLLGAVIVNGHANPYVAKIGVLQNSALASATLGTMGALIGNTIKTVYTFPIIGDRNNYKKYEKEIQKRLLE